MAVFRIERTRDYTVMSNHHLRNHELSLKAKGLLSMMLSLPDDWNYTTRGLAKICKEGVDAIGNALRELETAGYIVRHQLRDRQGRISYDELARRVRPGTRAVVCTHASNLTGNALDIARIGAIAHGRGALFIVDASQSAGVLPIDMETQHIDVLCFTGHKSLMGPQGTGGLCVREGVAIRPWKVGGTGVQTYSPTQPPQMPTVLEAGTLNGHGIAGLSAALDFLRETGIDTIRAHEDALARRFYEGGSGIPGVTVYGDFTGPRTAVVSLNIRDLASGEVSDTLSEVYGIATRPGAHCAPRLHRALGTETQGAVRFSFGWFNTAEETDAAIRAVREIAR